MITNEEINSAYFYAFIEVYGFVYADFSSLNYFPVGLVMLKQIYQQEQNIKNIEKIIQILILPMPISKSPNTLNLHAYTQGQQQSGDQESKNNSPREPNNSQSIQDQIDNILFSMNKQDDLLKNLALDMDDLATNQQILSDFYPQFIVQTTYENDQEKKIVLTSDPEIGKVVFNLSKINKTIKDQIKGWSMQFAKTAKLSQTLLSENEILRKAICKKNKELIKLIETISNTQNSEISEMKENLQMLKQQNGVLLDHLQKIKYQLKEKRQDFELLKKALAEKRVEKIEAQKQNNKIEDQEEHLSKTAVLIEDSLDGLRKRKKKLEKQKEKLTALRLDYTKDQYSIDEHFRQTQQDKYLIERQLKSKFEEKQEEKQKLIYEIDQLTENIRIVKEQTRSLQAEIERKQNRLLEFNNISKDLQKKHELNENVIDKLTKQNDKIIKEEGIIQTEILILTNEVDSLKEEIKQIQKTEEEIQENHNQALKYFQETQHQQLIEQKNKQTKQAKDILKKIFQGKLQLTLREKQVHDWEMKITRKKSEISELKQQMKQIRSNQLKLNELKTQKSIRQASLEEI